MNEDSYINSVQNLIATTESLAKDNSAYALFRGQPNNKPLLPKIARADPTRDTKELEQKMIKEFRRRMARERDIAAMDNWDLLVYAQHHGLATRLLDWTSNPLYALWFACSDYKAQSDGYIYLLFAKDEDLLDPSVEAEPFEIKKTYIVKPNVNNSRIRAQSGWFTVHRYSKSNNKFIDLHKNTSISGNVLMKGIHKENKLDILNALDKLGVNDESVYPGPEGTAKHINWLHRHDL